MSDDGYVDCSECNELRLERDRYKAALEEIKRAWFEIRQASNRIEGVFVSLEKHGSEIKRSCNEAHPGQDVHHPEGH